MNMVTGIFNSAGGAERACRTVIDLGYAESEINVVMSGDARQRYFPAASPTVADSGNLQEQTAAAADKPASRNLGGPVGGTIATLAPMVAAVGVLLIPGLGLVAGPVAVALAAAGAIGVAGGVVGMLTDWGIPSARIRQYEEGLLAGGILLGVKARSVADARAIQQKWRDGGGVYVHS